MDLILILLIVLLLGGGGFGFYRGGYYGGIGIGGIVLVVLALYLMLGSAHAQGLPAASAAAPVAVSIDLTAIVLAVIGGIFAVIKIVAESFDASRIKDAAARDVVNRVLDNALGAMQQAAEAGVTAIHPKVTIPGISPQMASGIGYALDQAGPELERLGITQDAIADKIKARLGLQNIATNLAVSASPSPIVAKPLDPVPGVAAGLIASAS